MGYNRNTARAVVYGPAKHGGIGIKHLYAEQSIAQITALLQHTRLNSPLGRTMFINLECVQMIAGIQKPVLEDTEPLQHMEGDWFKSTRTFLQKTACTIQIDGLWTPRVQRLHDKCIMDVLRTSQDTMQINRVRIYLQATTIADIANAEGTHITKHAFGGRNSRNTEARRKTRQKWPRQPRPGPKAWKAWREALQKHLSIDGKSRKLRQTLGKWILAQSKTRQEWHWYIDPPTGTLFQRDGNTFRQYQTLGTLTRFDPKEIGTITHMPRTAIPVTVTNFTIEQVPRNQHLEAPAQIINKPDTFNDYIDQLEDR
jgi:hypothetical protein